MAEEGQVIGCHTVESWDQQFRLGKESKKLVVVDFTASWCGPCRFIAPILADLAKKLPNVIILKVDVDELKTVAADWGVEAMPTLIYMKDGQVIDKTVGAKKDEIEQKIVMYSA
ncbi:ARABIDOPSIS THALIANA THIOREDOXIN H-TYPE 1, thioredoxin H-type 1 [Hibiscus trionum]|uniref:ARABIDOPSIS THALIANA THIOREDOXIN H-TYPE 1, thioredoxin H-type 1 n=1 Tax=Hibiscus trionum TaxID=183268 RepID=A0A9W7MAG1_HIBTR|nr:ARABIDOPSIS THALIANA THIOREDOXIN H-TYPE 1, thioredoxin H-type 1 [Hibiscus trionum]